MAAVSGKNGKGLRDMKLASWVKANSTVRFAGDIARETVVAGIAEDSREVRRGFLFAAIQGHKADGEKFIGDAVRRGAAAVLAREGMGAWRYPVPLIVSRDTRKTLAEIADAFYGNPSKDLFVCGVTGTNGKTTTTFLLKQLLQAHGLPAGWIGTVGYAIGAKTIASTHTTPGAISLARLLAEMRDQGLKAVSMEASSHALDQRRADAVQWDAAVFTNLTRDHLDYHGDMTAYLQSKRHLFDLLNASPKGNPCAVLNADDTACETLRLGIRKRCWTYGLSKAADFSAQDLRMHARGSAFVLRAPDGSERVELPLLGRFNVHNALAAAAVAWTAGMPLASIARGLASAQAPSGRMEFLRCGQPFEVIVDYAHTDDALANVLQTAREFTRGRLLLVFGCGGDRDKGKRAKMGRVAQDTADYSFLTSDNPRGEDPREILRDIEGGFTRKDAYAVVADRQEAIRTALGEARAGDTVILAGKGHEAVQIFRDKTVPFSDKESAQKILMGRREPAWNA